MTKSDCNHYFYAWTTASNGTEQVKIWNCTDQHTRQTYYFLDNGAECTDLVTWQGSKPYYDGGGWLERLLGKSIKANSKDIDKIKKTIIVIAVLIGLIAFVGPALYQRIKNKK